MSPAPPLSDSRWARARWLVLAPHPDDETLGAGALIVQAARDGRLAAVVYLTDGSGSHPRGTPGLIAARRREARAALRLLGACVPVIDLGWRDAHPPPAGDHAFRRTVQWMAALVRRRSVDAIATTGDGETHIDHVACAALAAAIVQAARRRVAVFEYAVWPGDRARGRAYRTDDMTVGRRRRALQAHRSQLGPSFGAGFRLPPARLAMPARDRLHLRMPA